jgi:glycosyltransferase involved in cell wall biosynthesis
MNDLTLSLVMPTIGRDPKIFGRCLDSIIAQGYPHLQVIIVDQNEDERVSAHLDSLRAVCQVIHLRAGPLGSSGARNFGASRATGDIISFPDDDSWFEPGLLEFVAKQLRASSELDGLSGRTIDVGGGPGNGRFQTKADWVKVENIWVTSIEFTLFLKREAFAAAGGFDETIAVGIDTPYMAGEGTDLMFRLLKSGYRIWYTPDLKVGHPKTTPSKVSSAKAYGYGLGMGYVAGRHRCPARQTLPLLGRPFVGAAYNLARGRTRAATFHFWTALGRSVGYFAHGLRKTRYNRPDASVV